MRGSSEGAPALFKAACVHVESPIKIILADKSHSPERGRGHCSPVLSIAILVPATWRPPRCGQQVTAASQPSLLVITASPEQPQRRPVGAE